MRRCFLFVIGLLIGTSGMIFAQGGEIINKKEQRRILEEGEYFYEVENYVKALEYFKRLEEIDPNDLYYKLVIGICYSYKVDEKEKSIGYLEKVKELNPDFNEVNLYLGRAYAVNQYFDDAVEHLELYLQDEDIEDEFAETARRLIENCENGRILVADSLEVQVKNVGEVVNSEHAEYVPLITPDESQLIFTYKGPGSLGDPDSKGEYFEDIYVSYKSPDDWLYEEDVWLEPESIESINTENDDACIAISIDGQKLFLYKYEKSGGGDIYISELDGKIWSEPLPLDGGINTKYWEGSVAISSDERELYFASDRPGGYGGRDLYKAEKLDDGTWGNIQNLGPEINTPYNDDSPYIQIDKRTLFYSSEGHNTMGGYDIFFSRRDNEREAWSAPANLGYPINTVEDDRYFVINASGQKGFYSSSGLNSMGDQDLFYVELDPERIGIKSIAALIIGTVFADDTPVKATLNIMNETLNSTAGVFQSNSETGNYGIALAPGYAYSIKYVVDSNMTHTDEIDLTDLNEYIEVSNNVFIYSEQYAAENNIVPKEKDLQAAADSAIAAADHALAITTKDPPIPPDITTPIRTFGSDDPGGGGGDGGDTSKTTGTSGGLPLATTGGTTTSGGGTTADGDTTTTSTGDPGQVAVIETGDKGDEPCDDEFVDLSAFVGRDLNDVRVYNELLGMVGNYCADQLVFRVQIGAYRFPENFKYPNLLQFGEAVITDYPDGITRFTMGEYITLKEADDLRQKIMSAGQEDAWVVPFFDGKRMFMEDMIKVNFYNRSIN